MKIEKEIYTREEVKKLVSWLMNKCERDQERYIKDEEFLVELMTMNPLKRIFLSGKILKHLNEVLMTDTSNSILEEI